MLTYFLKKVNIIFEKILSFQSKHDQIEHIYSYKTENLVIQKQGDRLLLLS